MKRRDLLKGFTLATGALTLAGPGLAYAAEPTKKDGADIARPIRGLRRVDGRLRQPIRITPPSPASGDEIAVAIDGHAVDRRTLSPGSTSFDVFLDPVSAPRQVELVVTIGAKTWTQRLEVLPVRRMDVFVLPHSHHDLGYTERQADVEDRQVRNITRAIELARQTERYPDGSRFVWNLEVLWGADLYLRRASAAGQAEFVEAVKKGWIALNGAYANELTGLCRPEELIQLFRFGTELAERTGTPVDSAMMSDVPGYTWGTVEAMAQAGIRYFSAAPNYFDRIGRFMDTLQDKPFWWVSPSGKSKVLFWIPWTGYAMSHVMKADDDWVGKYQARMDEVKFPYDISYVRWAGHGDNAEPDPGIVDFVKAWNATYEWPKFTIASTSTAFRAFEQKYGHQLPRMQGDLTPYWEDGAASSAAETALNRNAAERLSQAAAALALVRPDAFDRKAFDEAWRNVLLYSEHTWGAAASVTEPEAAMTTAQWEVKRSFAVEADRRANELLALAGQGGDTSRLEIVNTSSWPRGGIAMLPKSLSGTGDRVTDAHGAPWPSQRLANGDLAVLMPSIAGYASTVVTLSNHAAHAPATPVTFQDNVLSNGLVRIEIHPSSGDVVGLYAHGSDVNLVDGREGWALNQFLLLRGDDVDHLERSHDATVVIEDHGPLVLTLRIDAAAPLCRSLTRRVRLAAGQDFVELHNTVDKERAAYSPTLDRDKRHPVLKESIQFAFPFAVPGGQLTLDEPFAQVRPEYDQLPGSCKNWMPVGRWADVSNADHGVTWATLDAPLVEVGSVTATKLNSQTDPDVWIRNLEPTQTFFSWVMNNHWGTNYRAWQEGPVTFRYALRPHGHADVAEASRFATGLSQPLLVLPVTEGSARRAKAFVRVEPESVLVEALTPSADGRAWIMRLRNASDAAVQARIRWSERAGATATYVSDTAESERDRLPDGFSLAPGELFTMRTVRRTT
ncbi:hypothetical protein [Luteibacter sp. CQ10]|uniref:glycoside hydrolase family 38 N-terminal domain-containing protein n=1 Tax=Luteibacter sp. CQ10 TaxID=2805821 RepID=UPI0034A299C4